MEKKMSYLTVALMLLSFTTIAQITGRVVEKSSEPVLGATVLIKGTTNGSITDLDGKFVVNNVSAGQYELEIVSVGYDELILPVDHKGKTDLGDITLEESTVALQEVEVFADIVEERKAPVAISTISSAVMEERFASLSIADAVQNTPGVYSTQGAGGYGDQEIYIRGFDQSNVAFLVNGVPVNDMESGRMFWSNFAGLNQVTQTTQVQRGLGASKLAVSSIGGTVNMVTKPADRSKGGRVEYMTGTGSWNNRLRFTYNTGLSDNGWAFSMQGTRTTTSSAREGLPSVQQGPVMPGGYVDAWSYYLSASKKINNQHQLMFWAFGAPFNRGTGWTVSDRDREVFNIDEPMFNGALGYRNGELFNARQNSVHKPLTALTHYWDIDQNTSIVSSVYYSGASVSSTSPRDAEGAPFFFGEETLQSTEADEQLRDRDDPFGRQGIRAFFPARLPYMVGTYFDSDGMIQWDYLADQNRSDERYVTVNYPNGDINQPSVSGYASRYYLENRHNNHNWVGIVSNFTKQINQLRVRAGIDGRYYKGEHYATVGELLGGDFILNEDELNFDYNQLDGQNTIARRGDKTNYNYDGYVNWLSGFAQGEWILNKFIAFGSATVTYSDMQRVGHFWYGRSDSDEQFNLNSLGKSERRSFTTYTVKAGLNYKITGRHNVYVNGGMFTRPPFFRNAFADARYSNQYREGLKAEDVKSIEAGYGFKLPFIKGNLNGYYLLWSDRTTQLDYQVQGDEGQQSVIPMSLTGLVSEHKGIELDFVATPFTSLEINGYVGLGDWNWIDAPIREVQLADGSVDVIDIKSQLKGLPVGAAAQTTAGIGLHYKGIRSTYIGGRLNYADRIPVRYRPEDVLQGFITREVIEQGFDDYATVDLYAGRYFDVGEKMTGKISVNVNNVLDNEYTRWGGYSFNQVQRGYGFPRTYTIALSLSF